MNDARMTCENIILRWGHGRAHVQRMLDAVPPETLVAMAEEPDGLKRREIYNQALGDAKASVEGHE